MLKLCVDKYAETHDMLITFANTGCEHEETLRFADAVDRHFAGGKVVWIEAIINEAGKGPTAKVVDYETAARNGEPFRAAIEKHGVFSKSHPQCTSRLKEEPMISYRRQMGWEAGSYETAIGIRADEADRCSSKAREAVYLSAGQGRLTETRCKSFYVAVRLGFESPVRRIRKLYMVLEKVASKTGNSRKAGTAQV